MRKSSLIFCVFLLFSACNKAVRDKNEINKIEIAIGGSIKREATISLQIDSSLKLKYYVGQYSKLKGFYEGQVSQAFWDSLNMKLKIIHYEKLDTSSSLPIDGEAAEAILYSNKQKRHLFYEIDGDPD